MIPTTGAIMEKRHACRRRLRYTALYLMTTSTIFLAVWVAQSLFTREWWWSGMAYSLAFAAPAVPLWLFDRWIARFIVPMPQSICPGCGYRLEALTTPRCPECGVMLPPVFTRQNDRAESPPTSAP